MKYFYIVICLIISENKKISVNLFIIRIKISYFGVFIMAYPPRIIVTGATYFITTQCINFEPFLQKFEMKDIAIFCIRKTQQKYAFELSAFGIMDNHLRLIIRTTEEHTTVSRIMQHIKANITRIINRRTGRRGTIWNERFKSTIIETVADAGEFLRSLLWYTIYDPLRPEGGTAAEGYHSMSAYTGRGAPPPLKVSIHSVFWALGRTWDECRNRFLESRYKA
ncbi:MAG: transposase [Spirochaetota bacterium]